MFKENENQNVIKMINGKRSRQEMRQDKQWTDQMRVKKVKRWQETKRNKKEESERRLIRKKTRAEI